MAKLPDEVAQLGIVEHLYHRFVASYLYFSGQLEVLRRAALTNGAPPWRIIRYQHIAEPERLPLPIARTSFVRPRSFERQMKYLRKNCVVLPLTDLTTLLEQGDPVPDRTVCVTIDGGWRDTYEHAYPILSRYGIPATCFLPTAFMGNALLLWQDKVMIAMLSLQDLKIPFPPIDLLSEEFFEDLKSLSPDNAITMATISLFVDTLSRLPPDKRLAIMIVLGQIVDQLGGIPSYNLFLDWNQITEMSSAGVAFGSLGHRHLRADETSREELAVELRESFLAFQEHSIRPASIFAFPEGAITKDARTLLRSLGVSFSLGSEPFGTPSLKGDTAAVLGRVNMFESVSFCAELFACRLWSITSRGIQY